MAARKSCSTSSCEGHCSLGLLKQQMCACMGTPPLYRRNFRLVYTLFKDRVYPSTYIRRSTWRSTSSLYGQRQCMHAVTTCAQTTDGIPHCGRLLLFIYPTSTPDWCTMRNRIPSTYQCIHTTWTRSTLPHKMSPCIVVSFSWSCPWIVHTQHCDTWVHTHTTSSVMQAHPYNTHTHTHTHITCSMVANHITSHTHTHTHALCNTCSIMCVHHPLSGYRGWALNSAAQNNGLLVFLLIAAIHLSCNTVL